MGAPHATDPNASTSDPSRHRISLPRIDLPHFSGNYEDWPNFRDLFNSLILKDETLPDVDKLHYLRTSLKGNAEHLIRNLPVIGDNFKRAWTMLSAHYENKRVIVRSCYASFTALQKMKSESVNDLRRIYHGMLNAVGSLEGIGRPISSGTDLFVHLVVDLLDIRTRREWEHEIGAEMDPPSYEPSAASWHGSCKNWRPSPPVSPSNIPRVMKVRAKNRGRFTPNLSIRTASVVPCARRTIIFFSVANSRRSRRRSAAARCLITICA